jgi:polysaccharide biosynthesis protein PelE
MSRAPVATETMKEPLAADGMAAFVVFAILSGSAFGVTMETISLPVYAGVHALCAVGASHWAWRSAVPPRRQAVLLAVTTLALGPVGALGTLLSVCLEAIFRPYASPFTEWYDRIFAEEDELENDAFLQRLAIGGDPVSGSIQLTSFRDILAFGTIDQKQAIIALIARRFTPAFAPALRLALEDPIAAVRVQAAAAAASIENRYAQHSIELTREAELHPHSLDAERDLARHYADFAQSGLVEQQRATEAADQALTHFDKVLARQPSDGEALVATARLLLDKSEAREAVKRLERAIAASGVTAATASLYVEALLQLGRFTDVHRAARAWAGRFRAGDREAERLNAALNLWVQKAVHA